MQFGNTRYGWAVRTWSEKPAQVKGRVDRFVDTTTAIRLISTDEPIVFLVPRDKDCGETAAAMREMGLSVLIEEVDGSPNIKVLNRGLEILHEAGCTHAISISGKAVEAITPEVMRQIGEAFGRGAKAVGVGFSEFMPFVAKIGLLNTFAAYELQAVHKVGGFTFEHPNGGVEEVSLLLALIEEFGRCIAVVESDALPKVMDDQDALERFAQLIHSKMPRIEDLLAERGLDVRHLTNAIMWR